MSLQANVAVWSRLRAERRLGGMLAAQKAEDGLSKGGRPAEEPGRRERPVLPTLADVGISKDLSSRAQAIAAVPEKEFETEVATWRDRVSKEGERVTARLVSKGLVRRAVPAPTAYRGGGLPMMAG